MSFPGPMPFCSSLLSKFKSIVQQSVCRPKIQNGVAHEESIRGRQQAKWEWCTEGRQRSENTRLVTQILRWKKEPTCHFVAGCPSHTMRGAPHTSCTKSAPPPTLGIRNGVPRCFPWPKYFCCNLFGDLIFSRRTATRNQ